MNVVRIEDRAPARPEPAGSETAVAPGERARLHFRQARAAALEHLGLLEGAIKAVRELSLDLVQGGDAYPVGVRELAARLAEDLLWRGKTLEALTERERADLLAH